MALLALRAQLSADRTAVSAPGRAPLSYDRLFAQAEQTSQVLRGAGIAHNDRVAVVLPNGPEMAVAMLATAGCAVCAPLNPTFRAREFAFYFRDLRVKALIALEGDDGPAASVAKSAGLTIIELRPEPDSAAGQYTLLPKHGSQPADNSVCQPGDVALVLHTSGTTSRPKIVPLTHTNVCTSARNVAAALQLTPGDGCLNVMPLFHIHGFIGALLSSVTAAARVECTDGFTAGKFGTWLQQSQATWYTAVPTIHQALLAPGGPDPAELAECSLRFVRSCSAPLPVRVFDALERTFQTPVIEAFGMTEAAHQVASNPLPPRARKPGSVGIAAGPDIGIVDERGQFLMAGETGEVVIRGANVMQGYENLAGGSSSGFVDGWFRTGDQGYLDSDDYLFLAGRIKEIINRGGEKISPREIDEVLCAYPGVVEGVTFAMPHPTLGEEVGAAVVLRQDAQSTEREIQNFVRERVADFKTPRTVLIVDAIPRGPTGKVQRIGLAERLGVSTRGAGTASEVDRPQTATEEALARLWAQLLDTERIGPRDNFFELGGDSLAAVHLFAEIERLFDKRLPLTTLFNVPTIEELAMLIGAEVTMPARSSLVPIQPRGTRLPLFFVHGLGGGVLDYGELGRLLAPDQPFYGLQGRELDGVHEPLFEIEAMAAHYIKEIQTVQPTGPYRLGGYCYGGLVAYEMAQQLHAAGEEIALLVMLERSAIDGSYRTIRWSPSFLMRFAANVPYWFDDFRQLGRRGMFGRIRHKLRAATTRRIQPSGPGDWRLERVDLENSEEELLQLPEDRRKFLEVYVRAAARYVPRVYPGRVAVLRTRGQPLFCSHDPQLGWGALAGRGVSVRIIPGTHRTVLKQPHVAGLAQQLRACLDQV
jgi:acyl-CoA synthetase (AMP-forming)/AMP-acid ligase II/thioesterase domain-containing protein/acyl carrier protein